MTADRRSIARPDPSPDRDERMDEAAALVERALCGALLLSADDADGIAACRALLSPDDFSVRGCRQVFAVVVDLYDRRIPPNPVTVYDGLCREADPVFGLADLLGLVGLLPGVGLTYHAPFYARLVKDHARRRRMREEGVALVRRAYGREPLAASLAATARPRLVVIRNGVEVDP